MNLDKSIEKVIDVVLQYGPRLAGAIAVLIIGLWVVKALTKGIMNILDNRNIDDSLKPFLKGLINTLLKVLLVVTVLGTMGIEMTSFIAILGAIGLAIGMALSGTLQNFAGGVMILLFKPFKVGDYIQAQGHGGTVNQIQIFNTILKTPDNVTIIIPNGELSNASLKNYSQEERRRVDWTLGIGYGDSAEKAEKLILKLCEEDQRILKDPEAFVALSELADSSVNFVVRAWVKAGDYWGVKFDMNRKIYESFGKEGLNIPYPQMDVHVHSQTSKPTA